MSGVHRNICERKGSGGYDNIANDAYIVLGCAPACGQIYGKSYQDVISLEKMNPSCEAYFCVTSTLTSYATDRRGRIDNGLEAK
jgi:hypothetical protein